MTLIDLGDFNMKRTFLLVTIMMTIFAHVISSAQIQPEQSAQEQNSADLRANETRLQKVREILRESPLIDGHNDTPWQYMRRVNYDLDRLNLTSDTASQRRPVRTDLKRLRAGCVGAQFWAVYVPPPKPDEGEIVKAVFEQIDFAHRLTARHADSLEFARSADDIERIHRSGKIASLIGVEGGHAIDNSLAVLRMLYACGARYLTLTHSKNNGWADSATDKPVHGGLTPFGIEVIRELNRLGMLVDLSHTSDDTARMAMDVSKTPVIFSHSCARAVCDVPRNVPDDILKLLAEKDGIIMVTFMPEYVAGESNKEEKEEEHRLEEKFPGQPEKVREGMRNWWHSHHHAQVKLPQVADQIDHIRKVAGIDHVGIGSDFEGFWHPVTGLEDVSCLPALLAELMQRGYTSEDIKKIAGLNFLRVFRAAEKTALRLQSQEN